MNERQRERKGEKERERERVIGGERQMSEFFLANVKGENDDQSASVVVVVLRQVIDKCLLSGDR